jgi:hypothetical protein
MIIGTAVLVAILVMVVLILMMTAGCSVEEDNQSRGDIQDTRSNELICKQHNSIARIRSN